MAMRRIFWGFSRNWFLIDPLHYLSSHSDFGFEFAEIFLIEKRLPDSPTQRVREPLTPQLGKSGICLLPDSASWGVDDDLIRRVGESLWCRGVAIQIFKKCSSNYSTLNG
jgi:hypothetical protein